MVALTVITAWTIALVLMYFFVVPWLRIQVALIKLWFIGRKFQRSPVRILNSLGDQLVCYSKKRLWKVKIEENE